MSRLEKYPSYKDSGVEWLGEIPEGWKVKKIKFVSLITMGQSPENKDVNQNKTGLPFLQGNAEFGSLNPTEKNWCIHPKKIAFKDEILYSVRAPVGAVNIANKEYCIGRGLCSIRDIKIQKKYLYYSSILFKQEFDKFSTGSTFEAISTFNIKNIKIPLPLPLEQTKIASFLNEKTAKIDEAINQKQKLIELLKERRQITINEAVTKGLDKAVEFVDSGVEWLGEIPEHWQTQKMKYLGKMFAGLTDKKGDDFSKEISEDKKPFIPFTNVCNNVKIDSNQMQYVKVKPYEKQNKVQKNDIIFLMSSETLDDIGKCSIHLDEEQFYLNSFCKGFRPKAFAVNAEFLNYLLQSKTYRNYFALVGRGFTRINIKQEYINDLFTVLPPKEEQTKIASFLDEKTAQIDKAIGLQQNYIAKLKEYKSSLIDSVVTGKVRVV